MALNSLNDDAQNTITSHCRHPRDAKILQLWFCCHIARWRLNQWVDRLTICGNCAGIEQQRDLFVYQEIENALR